MVPMKKYNTNTVDAVSVKTETCLKHFFSFQYLAIPSADFITCIKIKILMAWDGWQLSKEEHRILHMKTFKASFKFTESILTSS